MEQLMGKVLQVRVSVSTWNEDLVEKSWPNLSELAFSVPIQLSKHGVQELIQGLAGGLNYLDWSDERKKKMGPGINSAEKLYRDLERALANWQIQEANRLTDQIELVLDKLEDNFVK